MRTTIDAAGRVVVPKPMRDSLGLGAGAEIEITESDGRLEIAVPSVVAMEEGPNGPRFAASAGEPLTVDAVRDLIERGRR